MLLFADPVRPAQPHLNKTASVDQNGRFSITGVAPGDYKLYALDEALPELSKEAQAFEPFSGKAVKLHVEEGEIARVQLSTLKLEDPQGR